MFIIVAAISILAITGLFWLLNRILPFRICPVCAGVSGTWIWMLAAKFLGYEIDMLVPAMLMGGSVVGIAYQIEKRYVFGKASADAKALADKPASKLLLWKMVVIPAGFAAAYGVLSSQWFLAITAIIFIVMLTLAFIRGCSTTPNVKQNQNVAASNRRTSPHAMRREEIKKKLDDCC